MNAPARPVMVFDGGCGFCRRWIARWRHATGEAVEYVPFQEAAERFPQVPLEAFARAVHLIEPDGKISQGAEAVFRSLARAPGRGWLRDLYGLPLFAPVSEACYRMVARHRTLGERLTNALWGAHVVPPGEARTVALFLRLMGAVYAVAFISLWVQISGLIGSHGILPAQEYLDAARSQLGAIRYWFLPTLCWFGAGNLALHLMCAAGVACSILAMAGLVPAGALAGAWLGYLSLASVGQVFLRFQWDGLLLEAGFVAILLAPWRARSRFADAPPPSRAALWLARWLLFRLMFSSAAVKLASGDPTWHSLTALQYHYFTQPLPPWTAWTMHHLPAAFQKLSTMVMFAVEGLAPFLMFGPRRIRFAGAVAIAGLQVLILLTGNYGFFNLLTLVLCVLLLDDGVGWSELPLATAAGRGATARAGNWLRRALAALLFMMSFVPLSHALGRGGGDPGLLEGAYRAVSPLQVVNPYGLFAVMTTDRPQIVIEGSRDGVAWQPYEFRYQAGDLSRRPAVIAGHMPRLDWQMWFAALGDVRQNRWFLVFCLRLLEGSSDVSALLARDPFAGTPPRYLRARVYEYRFTTREERARTGNWWTRTLRGDYIPTLTLVDGQLSTVPEGDQ